MESIKSVSQYVQVINDFKESKEKSGIKSDLLFRGQRVDWDLTPKIARLDRRSKNMNLRKTEELILKEFERGIIPLTEFNPENQWDLIALAQHHGLPTRLLDWTYNALAALWFAVENPPENDEDGNKKEGVVWILTAESTDYVNDVNKQNPFTIRSTKVFRSKVVTRRISAQSGIFSIHFMKEKNKIFKFESTKKFRDKFTKLTIEPKNFNSIRKELNILGINTFSIYPDLDGFCKHISWRYSKLNDEK